MRVLHLPTTVGGGPSGLSHQLRLLGVDSHVWAINQNYLDYPIDREISGDADSSPVRLFKMLRAGSYVFGRWDAVNYNYGSSLFSTWHADTSRMRGRAKVKARILNGAAALLQRLELGILRARRIPVFVHYQGDDARQGDYSLAHYDVSIATQVPPDYYTPQSDAYKRRQIALMSRSAHAVYALNPDLMNVLPPSATFLPYGHVAVQEWEPQFPEADREPLVFAHAPSHRRVKGTELVLQACDQLASEGYVFELDVIEGVDNAAALERYRRADVVIDQLYAGWYGGVALEAMALGKPVVVYLRDSDLRHLPPGMEEELPFFRATPSTIAAELRRILEMPRSELVAVAHSSRSFAQKWHDPLAIASIITADYCRGIGALRRRRKECDK